MDIWFNLFHRFSLWAESAAQQANLWSRRVNVVRKKKLLNDMCRKFVTALYNMHTSFCFDSWAWCEANFFYQYISVTVRKNCADFLSSAFKLHGPCKWHISLHGFSQRLGLLADKKTNRSAAVKLAFEMRCSWYYRNAIIYCSLAMTNAFYWCR